MMCPNCHKTNTTVTESRQKNDNKRLKSMNVDNLPPNIEKMDYRVRRHRCNYCYYSFNTVETYFNPEDIRDLKETV